MVKEIKGHSFRGIPGSHWKELCIRIWEDMHIYDKAKKKKKVSCQTLCIIWFQFYKSKICVYVICAYLKKSLGG